MRATNGDNLQALIDEMPNGDTLLVETGSYPGFNISERSGLKIISEGVANIEGEIGISESRNITIRGFNLFAGVQADSVDGLSIAHNSLLAPIKASNCKRLLVERNNFQGLKASAVDAIQCGPGLVFSTNEIIDHQADSGIRLEGCIGAVVEHNTGMFAEDVKKGAVVSIAKDCEDITVGDGNAIAEETSRLKAIEDHRSPSKREPAATVSTLEPLSESNTAPPTEPVTEGEL